MSSAAKPPKSVLEGIYAFPPNRDTLGGTSYLILETSGNILVDSPPSKPEYQQFIQEQGGVKWFFITHRGNIGQQIKEIQADLGCSVIIQQQEAYLLPEIKVTTFSQEFQLNDNSWAIWTPGHSPGSSCLYYQGHGGILFSGRHLLPNPRGEILPLRQEKTFHWPRQLLSFRALRDRFSTHNLNYICPGANIGFLRGVGYGKYE